MKTSGRDSQAASRRHVNILAMVAWTIACVAPLAIVAIEAAIDDGNASGVSRKNATGARYGALLPTLLAAGATIGVLATAKLRPIRQIIGLSTEGDQRAEHRFQLLVEAAPSAMVVVDSRRIIRLVNRKTELLFDYPRSELIGQPIEMLVPDRFRPSHPDKFAGFMADPQVRAMGRNHELSGRRHRRPAHARTTPEPHQGAQVHTHRLQPPGRCKGLPRVA